MKIYTDLSEIEKDSGLLGYVRALQRAWNPDGGLGISQIGCLGNVPTIFIKECKQVVSPEQLHAWHRLFWNQGIASVLLIIDPRTAYVFSGMEPPEQKGEKNRAMVERWDVVQDFLSNKQSLLTKVESGDFYKQYKAKFNPSKSVDGYLTANLLELRNYLSPRIGEDCSHDFICRLLFVCYLVDRGIYSLPGYSGLSLHEALIQMADDEALRYLYNQFGILKTKFNGSMFDQNLKEESSRFKAEYITALKNFLHGDELAKGQKTLGFWAYDFKWIPVETISCIYENFLTGIDRKEKGAYYTPRLLAEMTIDCAVESDPDWHQKRYLDPSCGSGIFLVTLFNRLATYWQFAHKHQGNGESFYVEKDTALRHILEKQIVGIDIKQASCVLTCFILYIAFLDFFEPIDILTYQKESKYKKLPKLLKRKFSCEQGEYFIPVVIEDDALTTETLVPESFDVVFGNPPWVGRSTKQLALQFVDRAKMFLKEGGILCQLLPSKLFLNIRNEDWQTQFFQQWILDRVVQLADYSHILFSSAQAPSMILKASKGIIENNNHNVIYDTPKFKPSCRPHGMVLISALDRKMVRQSELLFQSKCKKAHVLWKSMFRGTGRDNRLLEYLDQLPKLNDLAGPAKSHKRWIKGQGFQPAAVTHKRTRKEAWWDPEDLYISAQQPILFDTAYLLKKDCRPVGNDFPLLAEDRKNNKEIFSPPMVLISQGFEKIVFCNFPVLFQDSLQ